MNKITVVATSYNLEIQIDAFLNDLYKQTFKDFNIVIVDDNSSDGTQAVIEKWHKLFGDRLKPIFNLKNLGSCARTRNAALKSGNINCEYIIFLDGDDRLEDNMLEKMYKIAVKENADMVSCAFDRIDVETGKSFSVEMTHFPKVIEMSPVDDMIAFANVSVWNKLWKWEAVQKLEYEDIYNGEDVLYSFNAYKRCSRLVYINDVLIHYYVRKQSVSNNTSEKEMWDLAKHMYKMFKTNNGVYKDIAGLMTFIHIGLSMPLRVANSNDIDLSKHIGITKKLFETKYDWFRNNDFMKYKSLKKHGVRGIAIWTALQAYRLNMFELLLCMYIKTKWNIKF